MCMDFSGACGLRISGHPVQALNAPRTQEQLRALSAKSTSCSGAETTRGAGDQHPFILQLRTHLAMNNPAAEKSRARATFHSRKCGDALLSPCGKRTSR